MSRPAPILRLVPACALTLALLGCGGGPRVQLRPDEPSDAPVYAHACLRGAASVPDSRSDCLDAFFEAGERGDAWAAGQLLAVLVRTRDDGGDAAMRWATWLNPKPWLPEGHPWREPIHDISPPAARPRADALLALTDWHPRESAEGLDPAAVLPVDLPAPLADPVSERIIATAAAAQGAVALAWSSGGAERALPAAPLLYRLLGGSLPPLPSAAVARWVGQADSLLRQGQWTDAWGAFRSAREAVRQDGTRMPCGWEPALAYGAWLSASLAGADGSASEWAALMAAAADAADAGPDPDPAACPDSAFFPVLAWLEAQGRSFAAPPPALDCALFSRALTATSHARGRLLATLLRDAREGHGRPVCPGLLVTRDITGSPLDDALRATGRADRSLVRAHHALVDSAKLPLRSQLEALDVALEPLNQRWHAAWTAWALLAAIDAGVPPPRWGAAPEAAASLCARALAHTRRIVHTDRSAGFESRAGAAVARAAVLLAPCGPAAAHAISDAFDLLARTPGGADSLSRVAWAAAGRVALLPVSPRARASAWSELAANATRLAPEPVATSPASLWLHLLAAADASRSAPWSGAAAKLSKLADAIEGHLMGQEASASPHLAPLHLGLRLAVALMSALDTSPQAGLAIDALARAGSLDLPPLWRSAGDESTLAHAEATLAAVQSALSLLAQRATPSLGALSDLTSTAQQLDRAASELTPSPSPAAQAWLAAARGFAWAVSGWMHRAVADEETARLAWEQAASSFRLAASTEGAVPLAAPLALAAKSLALAQGRAGAAPTQVVADWVAEWAAWSVPVRSQRAESAGGWEALAQAVATTPSPASDAQLGAAFALVARAPDTTLMNRIGAWLARAMADGAAQLAAGWSAGAPAGSPSSSGSDLGEAPSGPLDLDGPAMLSCGLSVEDGGWSIHLGFGGALDTPTLSGPWAVTAAHRQRPGRELGLSCAAHPDRALAAGAALERAAARALDALGRGDDAGAHAALGRALEAFRARNRALVPATLDASASAPRQSLPPARWTLLAWATTLARFRGHLLLAQELDTLLAEEAVRAPAGSLWVDEIPPAWRGSAEEALILMPLVELWASPPGPHGWLAASARALSFRVPALIPAWGPAWATDILAASFGAYAPLAELDALPRPEEAGPRAAIEAWRLLRSAPMAPGALAEPSIQIIRALAGAGWTAEAILAATRLAEQRLVARDPDGALALLAAAERAVDLATWPGLATDLDRVAASALVAKGDHAATKSRLGASVPRWWSYATTDVAWSLMLAWVHATPRQELAALRPHVDRWALDAESRHGPASQAALTTTALALALRARAGDPIDDQAWAASRLSPGGAMAPALAQAVQLVQELVATRGNPKAQRAAAGRYLTWLLGAPPKG